MLKIWGRKNSSNVRKALWIAHELGLEFQAIDAGGAFGVVNDPEYRARNPNGLVPMLEDDDLVLWESNTIVRYLCAEYGREQGWYLEDPRQRALADKWMD
ncbi:glutathione S-transferase N-terminal domain-containing protein, partial [Pseudomonas shirazensis]